jgi:RsiW-degrading membrane proteinase PrsW (M82 family)
MGGVFDSYGDAFLDNFNASVNGENSTKAFTIRKGPPKIANNLVMELYRLVYIDLLYNWNRTWFAILLSLVNIAATAVLVYYYISDRFKKKKIDTDEQ